MEIWEGIAARMPDILLPAPEICGRLWPVVACDQYTAQPEVWERIAKSVDGHPSTLNIILPEAYLDAANVGERVERINRNMHKMMAEGLLTPMEPAGLIYVKRHIASGARRGLMLALDLERYSFEPGGRTMIRATEGVIQSRIPPRVRIRRNAPLECPHILILIDDQDDALFGALDQERLAACYDVDLLEGGGRLQGYAVTGRALDRALHALHSLAERAAQTGAPLYAVGDGNHSLAAAQACWERIKKDLPEEQRADHPARFALCEIENLHDPAILFEPIHRVVFGVDFERLYPLMRAAAQKLKISLSRDKGAQRVRVVSAKGDADLYLSGAVHTLPVGTLQMILDGCPGLRLDYVHGEDQARALGKENCSFLLEAIEKSSFFEAIARDGAFPRKTFSMGEAHQKRYYFECRSIVKGDEP